MKALCTVMDARWNKNEDWRLMRLFIRAVLTVMFLNVSGCIGSSNLVFEGKSIDVWLHNLYVNPYSENEQVVTLEDEQNAQKAFRRMGGVEYNYLVDKLLSTNGDKSQYEAIVMAFRIAGTNATPVIPKLILLFVHTNGVDFAMAEQFLFNIGTNSILPLTTALSDKNQRIRLGAIITLGRFGPEARSAVPIMLNEFETEELVVRMNIIASLGLIRQYSDRVMPLIIDGLKNNNPSMRANALFAISWFTNGTEKAVPIVFKLLQDRDELIRHNAGNAILSLNLSKDYIPALIKNASSSDGTVRSCIAQALGRQTAFTNDVFPTLLQLTKDPDRYVREAAGIVLNQMDYKPPVNVVALRGIR